MWIFLDGKNKKKIQWLKDFQDTLNKFMDQVTKITKDPVHGGNLTLYDCFGKEYLNKERELMNIIPISDQDRDLLRSFLDEDINWRKLHVKFWELNSNDPERNYYMIQMRSQEINIRRAFELLSNALTKHIENLKHTEN